MHHRFGYQGTRDTSNHFTLPEALEFYESLGGLVSCVLSFMWLGLHSFELQTVLWVFSPPGEVRGNEAKFKQSNVSGNKLETNNAFKCKSSSD